MTNPTPGMTPGQMVGAGLDALFGGAAKAATPPTGAAPGERMTTLRYGTLSVNIPESQLRGRTVGQLFEDYGNDLGGVIVGANTTLRDTNVNVGAVQSGQPAQPGATYIASIRKEDKGSL